MHRSKKIDRTVKDEKENSTEYTQSVSEKLHLFSAIPFYTMQCEVLRDRVHGIEMRMNYP